MKLSEKLFPKKFQPFDFSISERVAVGERKEMHVESVFAVERPSLVGCDVALVVKIQTVGGFERTMLTLSADSDGENILVSVGNRR